MGLFDELSPLGAKVTHAHLVSPGGIELFTPLPPTIYGGEALVISRKILDEKLVARAVSKGAQLRENAKVERVEVQADCVRIHCLGMAPIAANLVIGCDGMPSVVRRSLGIEAFSEADSAFAIRGIYDGVELEHNNALSILWERNVLPAYGWVFPLPNGRANVGIGLRAHMLRKGGVNLTALMQSFEKSPRIAAMLHKAHLINRLRGHPLPFTSRFGPFVANRALLAGDAAGLVNPLTGEGIEYALESGELAGKTAASAISKGEFDARSMQSYAINCQSRFTRPFRLNGILQNVFAVPWLLDRVFSAARKSTPICEDIARITLAGDDPRLTLRMITGTIVG
jgi:flavin-dependent dehydrogenase